MKAFYGQDIYVQSAGVHSELEIDGFAVAVCGELGIELSKHKVRSFDQMEEWGEELSSFDLVVALSPASQQRAVELTRLYHLDIVYWPILDPTAMGTRREEKLDAYRQARDQIREKLQERFGPPTEA